MDGTLIAFLAGILVIGGVLITIITLTNKRPGHLDVEKYRSKWLAIEGQLKQGEVSSYHMCVLNADKLVDQALRQRHIKGQTMGERIKAANNSWSNANALWSAHKLRNQIAHESDVVVTYDGARHALAGFKQALKDIGAI